jgi:hypothetical protein
MGGESSAGFQGEFRLCQRAEAAITLHLSLQVGDVACEEEIGLDIKVPTESLRVYRDTFKSSPFIGTKTELNQLKH